MFGNDQRFAWRNQRPPAAARRHLSLAATGPGLAHTGEHPADRGRSSPLCLSLFDAARFPTPLFSVFSGGLLLGAIYMATDPGNLAGHAARARGSSASAWASW